MNNTFAEICEQLNNSKRVAVFCHARPDGDALGAGLAMCLALKKAGKEAYMLCEEAVPEKFLFLPSTAGILSALPNVRFDTLISVDCADVTRMGMFTKFYRKFKDTTINIDHHISNNGYAKFNYIRECSATCEILTEFFNYAGYKIDSEIADLLMVGLVTDSGNFTHSDVTENTFEIAAMLRKCGADVNLINYNVFARQPKSRALLYGRVMNKMRFALEDRLALIIITANDIEETGADRSLTEGFVDFPLSVDGVEVSAALLEYKANQYKVSLRSKGKANVNAVATAFGGGGHILASGCMLFGELEEVIEKLTYAVNLNL